MKVYPARVISVNIQEKSLLFFDRDDSVILTDVSSCKSKYP
ncbi:hypothetical protein LEP1GSC133_4586 [Leptospira borgpetersenii serovar Pomona str. 200901868]|uniref:Uncharacterized protein n=1 Tax=Leptospira borgpetersenii serovar Pomona str. 200901868 TaxID=1192866 RepID=M6WPL7_LEPBO|nr:hypothetical protein LEP1GSC133_4586 [Leptospira borgpetersenii serovar Pomona str. 200901868]